MKGERDRAGEEFLVNPAKIPRESLELVLALCEDWFLFDRKLTHCNLTPLELFIQTQARGLPAKEQAIYRRFLETQRFGLFRVEGYEFGEWMDIKALPRGEIHRVFDQTGSGNVERGTYLIARLIAFEDHWATSSFITKIPEESRYIMDRGLAEEGGKLDSVGLRPRHVLGLFMPKIEWEKEGIARVRARLASILERWRAEGVTVSKIEDAIRKAHENLEGDASILGEVVKIIVSGAILMLVGSYVSQILSR